MQSQFFQLMRFVAAALVLVAHTSFYYQERIDKSVSVWHTEMGVSIFFLISGAVMVISSSRLSNTPAGAKEFAARRLLRVVPLYWLVTVIKVGIGLAVPAVVLHNHIDPILVFKSFLFIPAFNAEGQIRPIHGVGWTLLHEMYFYALFTAAMALGRKPALVTSVVICVLYLAGLALQPQTAPLIVATSAVNLYFVIGMALGATLLRRQRASTAALAVGLSALAMLRLVSPATGMQWLPLEPLVLLAAIAMLLVGATQLPRWLHLPVALGNSSYSLYLFHPMLAPAILLAVHAVLEGAAPEVEILVAAVIVVAVAHPIYRFVETPLNHWVAGRLNMRATALHGATRVGRQG